MARAVKPTTVKTVTTTTTYELDTDEMEEIISKQLKFSQDARFDWQIGQWVRLVITESRTASQVEENE